MTTATSNFCFMKLCDPSGPGLDAVVERLQMFKREWPAMEVELDTATRHRDGAALSRAAHRLRRSLSALKFTCAELAGKIERHADARDLEMAFVLLPFLKRQVEAGIRSIESAIKAG